MLKYFFRIVSCRIKWINGMGKSVVKRGKCRNLLLCKQPRYECIC